MKALSIRQPFAWAILHAHKDIENRDWYTMFRGQFAIHAAKGLTVQEYRDGIACIHRAFIANVLSTPTTVQTGHGRISVASGELTTPSFNEITRGAIVGVADLVACISNSPSPWFQGKYGFVLRNVIALREAIPCKGQLSFWDVPSEIEEQIRKEIGK